MSAMNFEPQMSVTNFNYVAPNFIQKDKSNNHNVDLEKYPKSSNSLMSQEEVLDYFGLISRNTIYMWRKKRGFPNPITLCPARWLRDDVTKWQSSASKNS